MHGASTYPSLATLWDLRAHSGRVALVEDGRQVTYDELADLSDRIARAVPQSRSLVFCLCSNTVGSVAAYLGFMNHGTVPLLLDVGIERDLLGDLIERYRPSYLWVPDAQVESFAGMGDLFSCEGHRLLATGLGPAPLLSDQLALLMSTSGSTGSPKLVRLSAANVRSNTDSIVEYLRIRPDDRAITSLQMSYVYGLSVINTHLRVGASLLLTKLPCYSKGFWQAFDENGATSFAGVPFMYEMLGKLNFTKKEHHPTMRTMTQAGGKLSEELQERFSKYASDEGFDFVVMYGASEATARMGYLPPERALDKRGSMGVAIPGGRFELVDADGAVIEGPDTVGELVYYGQNVSLGYSTCADDLAKGDENLGRLETGDMAKRDADGFHYVVGRKKRFVKMLGKRTNLDEVEAILKERLGTIEVACGGRDDLLCVFVTEPEAAARAAECVWEVTGINRRQVKVVEVDEIPKNASGKTLYSKLNEMVG